MVGIPKVPEELFAAFQAEKTRHRPSWFMRMTPNTVVVIGMVSGIAQEARILLKTSWNPAERIDLEDAREKLNDHTMEKINATSMGITDWALVCTWAYTPEVKAKMEGIRQTVLTQAGIAFPTSGATSEISVGKEHRAGESTLTEEDMSTLTDILHEHGGPRGI